MKHSLQLRLSQHLTLTPQLQQSIRLLQLSTLELNQELERFLQDNPLLERDDPADGPPALSHLNGTERPTETATAAAEDTGASSDGDTYSGLHDSPFARGPREDDD